MIKKKACNMTHSYKDSLTRFETLAKFEHISSYGLNIIWEFPAIDEVVLNCDGLAIENGRMSACEGVVHDHTWFFICGFISNLGGSSILIVELKAILLCLKLAWSQGYRKLRVNFDSQLALMFLSKGFYMTHPCYNIVSIHDIHANEGTIT